MLKKNSDPLPHSTHGRAVALARVISDKKGQGICVFDLRGISSITDYFVIAEGLSEIHNRTIADYLSSLEKPNHIEGRDSGSWVLLDFIDVIVHIFSHETRLFYGLERLWGDAPRIGFADDDH
jgi:ribosome-associated protein